MAIISLRLCHSRDNCFSARDCRWFRREWQAWIDQSEVSVCQLHKQLTAISQRETERYHPNPRCLNPNSWLPLNLAVRCKDRRGDGRAERNQKYLACEARGRHCEFSQLLLCRSAPCCLFTYTVFSLWSYERCHITGEAQRLILRSLKPLDRQTDRERANRQLHTHTVTAWKQARAPAVHNPTKPGNRKRKHAFHAVLYTSGYYNSDS